MQSARTIVLALATSSLVALASPPSGAQEPTVTPPPPVRVGDPFFKLDEISDRFKLPDIQIHYSSSQATPSTPAEPSPVATPLPGPVRHELGLYPDPAWKAFERVLALREAKDVEGSRAAIQEAERLDRKIITRVKAFYAYRRGQQHLKCSEYEQAAARFTEAIGLDPKLALAYRWRATALFHLGRIDATIEDLDRAIAAHPDDPGALADRATALAKRGDLDRSLADFDASIRLAPDSTEAIRRRAHVRESKGSLDGAEADATEVIRREPTHPENYIARAEIRTSQEAHRLAVDDCTEAIRLSPVSPIYYASRSFCRTRLGDHPGALADAEDAVRLDASSADAMYARANARRGTGDGAGALADVEAVLRESPDLVNALVLQSVLLAQWPDDRLRDGRKALEAARRACALTHRSSAEALLALAAAHAELGDFRSALVEQLAAAARSMPQRLDFAELIVACRYVAAQPAREHPPQPTPDHFYRLHYGFHTTGFSPCSDYLTFGVVIQPGVTLRLVIVPALRLPIVHLDRT
jgi:tetratricopeptide (TPR) repeat protein